MMREVYFIQSKYPNNTEDLHFLLKRWDMYGAVVRSGTGSTSIVIVSLKSCLRLNDQYSNLQTISDSSHFLINLYATIRDIQRKKYHVTLVAGDNQISFFFCSIVKMFFPSKVRIQIQFHGDIYSFHIGDGYKGILRSLTSRVALRFSDSIRIVSQFQKSEILRIYQIPLQRFVVAPVQIDYSKIPFNSEIIDGFEVAIVGRLQKERGVIEAVSILKALVKEQPNLRVAIVGEGSLRGYVTRSLEKEIEGGSVQILGPLIGSKLRFVYAQSRVLLSTAPREGYGLTIREAALSGMRILARDSEGARQASRDFPESFTLFTNLNQAISAVPFLLNMERSPKGFLNFMQDQQKRDKGSLERLIQSWTQD